MNISSIEQSNLALVCEQNCIEQSNRTFGGGRMLALICKQNCIEQSNLALVCEQNCIEQSNRTFGGWKDASSSL